MALIPVDTSGQVGIVKDISPFQLPANAWSDGNNVRLEHGAVMKSPGYSSVIETCPIAPYYITQIKAGTAEYWVVAGLNKIYVHNGTSWTNITRQNVLTVNGAILAGASSITVDTGSVLTSLSATGTLKIGSGSTYEVLTYSARNTSTGVITLTGTTSYAHADGINVTPLNATTSDNNYSATASENWLSTVIGGVLVLTNNFDPPQEWTLSSGVPSVSNKLSDLTNWQSGILCKSLRSFRSFLVSLNITRSGTPNSRVVKWSTEAPVNGVPSSWDENDATVDAGEYSLEDTKGAILDGLPLQDTFMIYKEDSIYAMTYVGTPFIFAFRQISPNVGLLAKNCVTEFDGGHFIFGNGDMYINDGQRIKSILPHKMRDYLFSYIDGDQYEKSFCVTDYNRSEVLACFPSADNITGQVDKALVWNWHENTFSLRDLPDLGYIAYGTIKDETALSTWATATPTWTTVDGRWASNWNTVENVLVFASPTNTKVYRDRVGFKADGVNMRSYIERTGYTMDEQNAPDQSSVKHIKAVWPKVTIDKNETVDVYIGTQMSTEEAVSWEGPIQFNPDSQSKISCRATGKLYGIRIESDSDAEWRLEGLAFEVQNSGRRGSRAY
jgi:hypothetical protein